MEEKFQKARILENIEKYLKFEGIAFNDELMVTIHSMLIEAKKALEPQKNNAALNIFMDLLHRKIDFTTDISALKDDFYMALEEKVKNLYDEEENVEVKITLGTILNKFKNEKYKEEFYEYTKSMNSFDKEIEYTEVEGCPDLKVGSPKMSQFEKDLQWIIMLSNEKKPNQNGQKQYVDGGGIDWNSRNYFGNVKENYEDYSKQ
jgi:hypothetical protein